MHELGVHVPWRGSIYCLDNSVPVTKRTYFIFLQALMIIMESSLFILITR
jgi:hypothetical protein